MNRRVVMAFLKVAICALLFPGCTGFRLFHKHQDQDSKKPDTATAKSASFSGENLIPKHPNPLAEVEPAPSDPAPSEKPEVIPTSAEVPIPFKPDLPKAEEPLVKALESVLKNRHNEALKYLEAFDAATQDLLLRLLPMLATLKEKGLDKLSSQEVGNMHEQLESLLNALRPRTDLVIDKMYCCEKVKGFGDYIPVAEGHVNRPGEFVFLYVELRNFRAEQHGPFYEIRLTSRARIHDLKKPGEPPLWECVLDDPKEPMRIPLNLPTYFQNYRFVVPPNLQPGLYALTLTVTDESQPDHPRVAERSMEFRVTSGR